MRKCVYRQQLDLEDAGCGARPELSAFTARVALELKAEADLMCA
jgi:hypothetical protein